MRLFLAGVRGSTPAPGPDFVRYGGNTSCVAVATDTEAPRLVIDAGTGLSRFSRMLEGGTFGGTILLGHLHWDHTHGLPFFPAGDRDDAKVQLLLPAQGNALEVLSRAMSPPHFPITPAQLRGEWNFESIEPGKHEIEGFSVLALEIPHKGGRTFGYRVSDGSATIAYLSDHSPIAFGPGPRGLGVYHEAACELGQGVDLLIHDAQHTAEEFPARAAFGHAALEYAVGLAEECKARKVLFFHHDPSRTDAALDAIVAGFAGAHAPSVDAATEGRILTL